MKHQHWDFNSVERVVEAAQNVLDNIIDSEGFGPREFGPEHDDWPTDSDGDVWYPDIWELREALKHLQEV